MSEFEAFERWLKEHFPTSRIRFAQPMREYTTFRVGGPARFMVQPVSPAEIALLTARCREMDVPWFVMGNGSNLLVSDAGYDGLVIRLGQPFSAISVNGREICAQTGVLLSRLSHQAARNGLAGLEFAAGIPGTLGGGLVMNAGAYDGELAQVVKTVTVLDENGQIHTLSAAQMAFGYRTSTLQAGGMIALEAVLLLQPGEPKVLLQRIEELNRKRREKQPLEYASAGSTFRRPAGYYAGKLIEEAGLKGAAVGGAQVSEKHCGFIINTGTATAADIYDLCKKVQETVYRKFQVELDMEVRLLGRF